jgi:hypothetical protein
MKALTLILAAALASPVWADVKSYLGDGEYRTMNGETGTYHVQMDILDVQEGQAKVTSTYTMEVDGQAQTVTYALMRQERANSFFDLMDDGGNKVGAGYCFDQEDGAKVCHCQFKLEGYDIEETSMFKDNDIYRVGSKTANDMTTAFKEKLSWAMPELK